MKKILILSLLAFFSTNCTSDNFYNTQRILKTDKTEYNIGDGIILTLEIIPQKVEKDILLFENYKNLEISFSLFNDQQGNFELSEHSGKYLPESNIKTIKISKEKPFIKTFVGTITEKENNVEIHFPELNLKTEFSKEKLRTNRLRIHGFCNPISPEAGASLEEYFEVIDIKIYPSQAID